MFKLKEQFKAELFAPVEEERDEGRGRRGRQQPEVSSLSVDSTRV